MQSLLISLVTAEGYLCPYPELGFDGINDLIYDYYTPQGNTWIRTGETGWITRDAYCFAKGDPTQHPDAGEAKCVDSVNKCVWSDGICLANFAAEPDCIELCRAVLNDQGLECLGGDCPGDGDRDSFYAICEGPVETATPIEVIPECSCGEPEIPVVPAGTVVTETILNTLECEPDVSVVPVGTLEPVETLSITNMGVCIRPN